MAHGPAGHLLLPVHSVQAAPVLVVANTAQAQASESPTLATGSSLVVANSAQTQASTSPALVQHHVLTVANSAQAQASQDVTLVSLLYPTAVHASGRYLVDQHGDPWLGVGDTAWSIVGSLTNAQIDEYLNNRAAKGVNLTLLSAPEPYYVQNPPENVDGALPFTGSAFQSTLNNAYWNRVDYLVAQAASLGITCLICPFYLGFPGTFAASDADAIDGWATEIIAASNAQMRTYAGYLYARYGSAENVMWLIGHDRKPGTTLKSRAEAFIDEFWNVLGSTQLMTYGGARSRSVAGANDFGIGTEEWATTSTTYPPDFDTQYDYSEQIAVNAYTMWSNSPTLPFLFFEGRYESEPDPAVAQVVLREQMWAGFFAGAFAVIFGNNPIWNFENGAYYPYPDPWQDSMDLAGSNSLQAFGAITATLGDGWTEMSADTESTFCTTQGTGTNRVAARFGPDGGLVYHPAFTAGSITLDLTEFDDAWSTVTVTRIDPVSGAVTVVDASEATTNSAFGISAPAANSVGDNDWLFVVSGLTAKLTVTDSSQGQASTSPTLTQHHVLTVADSGQAQVSEAPALTQHQVLAVSSSAQAQASEQPTLVQHQVLTVDSSSQAQTSGSPSLVQHHVLTVDSSAQTQASENVTLHTEEQLSVQSSFQAQTSGEPSLVQHHVLVVQSSAQAQASQSPTLDAETITLVPASTGQDQASESPSLVQHQVLAVQSSAQAQTSTSPALVQHQVLVVASSNQTQASTTVNLSADDTSFIGGTVVVDVQLGAQTVASIYVGTDQVWP